MLRRDFLFDLGVLGLSALSLGGWRRPDDSVRVAVVGGGIAGLNCAYRLLQGGIQAKVYEADEQRVGGRMHSPRGLVSEGIVSEAGGEFIDGNHREIRRLVRELGLELMDTERDLKAAKLQKTRFHYKGQFYTKADYVRAFAAVAPRIAADRRDFGWRLDSPAARALDALSLEAYLDGLSSDLEPWLRALLAATYTGEYGLDAGEQSALNFISLISTSSANDYAVFGDSDERYKVRGGNARICEELHRRLPGQVLLGYRLEALRQAGSRYRLSFQNGKESTADAVVLCLPFSVLRRIDLKLDDMPPSKLRCINELGYGQNNKLLLGTTSRPWRVTGLSGLVIDEHIHNGWDSSQLQTDNQGAGSYTLFWGGTPALRLAEQAAANGDELLRPLPHATVLPWVQSVDALLPGFAAAYSGRQTAALWSHSPLSQGSYTCYRPGQWTELMGKEALPVGKVFFAGEHCGGDFQGFMEGAALSGRRAAQAILKA